MNISQCRTGENLYIVDLGGKDAPEALVLLKELLYDDQDTTPWEIAIVEGSEGMLLVRGARGDEQHSYAIHATHLGTQGNVRQETVEVLSMLGVEAEVAQHALDQYPFGCVFAINRERMQYYPVS